MSDDAYDLTPGELLSFTPPATGVIIGVAEHITAQQSADMGERLAAMFPGVRFAVVSGCSSLVSFAYDPEQP